MSKGRTRGSLAMVGALAATLVAGPVMTAGPALGAGPSVTIADPGSPAAGEVTLRGSVDPGSASSGGGVSNTTSAIYVVDASGSTKAPTGRDCSGNGVLDGADDLNGDGSVGDTLDCEIAAVRALDASISTSAGNVLSGFEAFAETAAVADLDPTDAVTHLLPPGYTGGDPEPRLVTAARSVTRSKIGLFTPTTLSGRATNLSLAVNTALEALGAAPAGPKYIFLLTDAKESDDSLDTVTTRLQQSGVKLRAFAISDAFDVCDGGSDLATLAGVTGESCVKVSNPASLASSVSGSASDSISGVTVSIAGVSLAAHIDAIGGWTAGFRLGAGNYTATATARLGSGAVVSATRAFTVQASPAGPAPGTVSAAPGSLLATGIKAKRPKPLRAALPKSVSGKVGRSSPSGLSATPALNGGTVVLQGRGRAGTPWTTVGRSKVVAGKYTVTWKRTKKVKSLRVQLRQFRAFAASPAVVVRTAKISRCSVKKVGPRRTLTCHTTIATGTKVRLLDGGAVLDRARVRKGMITVVSRRSLAGDVLSVDISKRRHVRLHL